VLLKYVEGDRVRQLKARSAIMAGGGYMTKYVVADLPQEQRAAYDEFHYAAYTLINVWVNNSRALDALDFGYSGWIWDPKIALYVTVADGIDPAGHAPERDPDRPNCITLWCPQLPDPELDGDHDAQCKKAREEMLARSFEDWETLAREELLEVFGAAGFDPAEDIEGIAVNRFGHAEVVCYRGRLLPGIRLRQRQPSCTEAGHPDPLRGATLRQNRLRAHRPERVRRQPGDHDGLVAGGQRVARLDQARPAVPDYCFGAPDSTSGTGSGFRGMRSSRMAA
jgi:hypothetical protein